MRHAEPLAVATAVAAAPCSSCSGEPPKTYELNVPAQWAVGEVVTRSERSDGLITVYAIEADEKEAPVASHTTSGETRIVQRCVEVDERSALRRSLVYVATAALLFHRDLSRARQSFLHRGARSKS